MKSIQKEKSYVAPEVLVMKLRNEGIFCESFGENQKPEPWSVPTKSYDMWNTSN